MSVTKNHFDLDFAEQSEDCYEYDVFVAGEPETEADTRLNPILVVDYIVFG